MKLKRGRRFTFYGPNICWPPMRWWHVFRAPLSYIRIAIMHYAWLRRRGDDGYYTITKIERTDNTDNDDLKEFEK